MMKNKTGQHSNNIKMGNGDALIMRSGAVKMRLPFDTEENRTGEYGNGPANLHY